MKAADHIKATTLSYCQNIEPERSLADLPHLAIVMVDLPHYQRAGLGSTLMKVIRYQFTDIGEFGAEGMSLGADTSSRHLIYQDMNPVVVGQSLDEVIAQAPDVLVTELHQRQLPPEMIALACLHAKDADQELSMDELMAFLNEYHQKSSWLEAHPIEVKFKNAEVQAGIGDDDFDWPSLIGEPS